MKIVLSLLFIVSLAGCNAGQLANAQSDVNAAQATLASVHAATTQASAKLNELQSQATTQPALMNAVMTEQKVLSTSLQAEAAAQTALNAARGTLNTIQSGTIDPKLIAAVGSAPFPYGPIAALILATVGPSVLSMVKAHQTANNATNALANSVPASSVVATPAITVTPIPAVTVPTDKV